MQVWFLGQEDPLEDQSQPQYFDSQQIYLSTTE